VPIIGGATSTASIEDGTRTAPKATLYPDAKTSVSLAERRGLISVAWVERVTSIQNHNRPTRPGDLLKGSVGVV
jgi:hypothetical protein